MNNQSLKYHSPTNTRIQKTITIPVIDLFSESIKSPATRASYLQALRQFEKATGFVLAKEAREGKALQNRLIEYVITLKHAGKSYSRLNMIISAVRKYVAFMKLMALSTNEFSL